MHKFERLIIYPMLFIALFFSFAGEEVQQTTAQQVHDELIAKSIKIVDDEGDTLIKLNTEKEVYGEGEDGNIMLKDSEDKSKTTIGSGNIDLNADDNSTSLYSSSIELNANKYTMKLGEYARMYEIEEELDAQVGYGIDIYSRENNDEENIVGKNSKFILYTDSNEPPQMNLYNQHGDELIFLGADKDKHGLINIYDKYGEDWRSYTYE